MTSDDTSSSDEPGTTPVKEKLEALKHISQTQRAALQERFKQEWRLLVTTISFFAVAAYTVTDKKLVVSPRLVIFAFLAIATVAIVALKILHASNEKNRNFAHKAEEEIDKLIGCSIFSKASVSSRSSSLRVLRKNIHFLWQSAVLLLFASVMAAVLCSLQARFQQPAQPDLGISRTSQP
jgi:hypothetical protein